MNPVRKDVRIQMETCEFLNIFTEKRSAMHEQRRTMVEEAADTNVVSCRERSVSHAITGDLR